MPNRSEALLFFVAFFIKRRYVLLLIEPFAEEAFDRNEITVFKDRILYFSFLVDFNG
jgi:hypothetical protein